ncbi:hypothetical protein EYR41_000721 [Orbilia oligospora]|uniref:Uncharacterized protein n=1 Tax=Orbilia oligospora TaxID=2813651 RepID=A0A7C8PTG8_ORBOL|nr:hypothetical protein TWF751_000886 [Orbilia oligospora]KAF3293020.1 hypothetical protein TWF132_005021 [Orbilia oligospora]TGJ73638.1 hypothetical protein EYR41_000721 [Orbilia oligospora]
METPCTPNSYDSSVPHQKGGLTLQLQSLRINIDTPVDQLSCNDPPWPGHIYVIKYQDTSRVLTYDKGKGIVLAEYKGKSNQRWTCHSKEGWLGFANDPGETTLFMGHYDNKQGKLHCWVNHHLPAEMFCVRKRLEDGFQILGRIGGNLHPVGLDKAGDAAVIRHSEAWWGFTMLA